MSEVVSFSRFDWVRMFDVKGLAATCYTASGQYVSSYMTNLSRILVIYPQSAIRSQVHVGQRAATSTVFW